MAISIVPQSAPHVATSSPQRSHEQRRALALVGIRPMMSRDLAREIIFGHVDAVQPRHAAREAIELLSLDGRQLPELFSAQQLRDIADRIAHERGQLATLTSLIDESLRRLRVCLAVMSDGAAE